MIAFFVKWLGVFALVVLVYRFVIKHVTQQIITFGNTTISFAFIVAAVFFILGARLTVGILK